MLFKLALNPYYNQTFIGLIKKFFLRLSLLLTGQLSWTNLATDEIQIFVLTGVAASSALVGAFLVLRKMTMLANSLSHTILMGIVFAYLFTRQSDASSAIAPMQAMLIASLFMGFVTTFLTEFLTKVGRLQEDASTGLIFTSLFALGVILVTILTRDAHIGLEAVMGNVDALNITDILWIYIILIVNVFILALFFKGFQITTFDPALAMALGFSNIFFNYLLMGLVSITAIGAFRAVGVLLVLAFMTGPVLAARLLTSTLKNLLLSAVGIGVLASFLGVALSRHILTVYGTPLSTSGVVVCMIAFLYLAVVIFAPKQGLIFKWYY